MSLLERLTKGLEPYRTDKKMSSNDPIDIRLLDEIQQQRLILKNPNAIQMSSEKKDKKTGKVIHGPKCKLSWFDENKERMAPKLGLVPIIEPKKCSKNGTNIDFSLSASVAVTL